MVLVNITVFLSPFFWNFFYSLLRALIYKTFAILNPYFPKSRKPWAHLTTTFILWVEGLQYYMNLWFQYKFSRHLCWTLTRPQTDSTHNPVWATTRCTNTLIKATRAHSYVTSPTLKCYKKLIVEPISRYKILSIGKKENCFH